MIIGLSSHSIGQATAAAQHPNVDYFCLGPLWATPTKPGRPHTTLQPVAELAQHHQERPWFAIGGIDEGNLDQVLAAGADRIVVVRAITEAADPHAAAAALATRLTVSHGHSHRHRHC